MILNPNLYRTNLDSMKEAILLATPGEVPKFNTLTLLSLGSHVPFAAVLAYALRSDVCGPLPELQRVLDKTIKFYNYEAITPWSDIPF